MWLSLSLSLWSANVCSPCRGRSVGLRVLWPCGCWQHVCMATALQLRSDFAMSPEWLLVLYPACLPSMDACHQMNDTNHIYL